MQFDLDAVYCGAIKRGDILLIRENDTEETVIVVQDTILNERLATVLVIPIEILKPRETVYKNEFALTKAETGLGKAGLCRPYHLRAVDRHHIYIKRGELSLPRFKELLSVVDINLGRFRDV